MCVNYKENYTLFLKNLGVKNKNKNRSKCSKARAFEQGGIIVKGYHLQEVCHLSI